jgi:Flp pilus assembly protein TadG
MKKATKENRRISRLLSLCARPLWDCKGGIAVTFSLALVPLMGCIALAIDVSTWYAARAQIQNVADGAALASARELRIGNATGTQVTEAARRHARSALPHGAGFARAVQVSASVSPERDEVTVSITSDVSPIFSRLVSSALVSVAVEATAKLSGTIPICMVGTDPSSGGTLLLTDSAELTAKGCGIHSNSSDQQSILIGGSARITAERICSTGGYSIAAGSSVTPRPDDGCPSLGDPLAHRQAPAGCSHSVASRNMERVTGTRTMLPGRYCDGILVENGAKATFAEGTYVIGGNGLFAMGTASITGDNVSFAFKGRDSQFMFGPDTSIDLAASKAGDLAGILFIEDADAPIGREFRISSNNAHNLLGTIYLPRGHLIVDSERPIASNSAYTVIVARRIELSNRPRLVLNTDYAATDVPVPEGVGPNSLIHLSQ